MIRGRCDDCDKTYKGLPSAERTYTCKQCGGVVRAIEQEAEAIETTSATVDSTEASPRCPSCDARLAPDARFCDACGARLVGNANADSTGSSRAGRTAIEREHSLIAKRAYGAMKTVRAIYWLNVVILSIAMLLVVIAYFAVPDDTDPDTIRLLQVALGIGFLKLGVSIVGAIRIVHRPFFWAILMASVHSLGMLLDLAFGGFPGILSIIILFYLWGALKPVARLQRLLEENPDLWNEQVESVRERTSRRKGARKGVRDKKRRGELAPSEAMESARERARQRRRESTRKTLIFGGGTVGVIGTVALVAFLMTRPPSFEDSTGAFFRAWNESDTETMTKYYPADRRERYAGFLERYNRRRGHDGVVPKVFGTLVEYRSEERAHIVFYDSEEVPYIVVRWKRGDDGHWFVSGLTEP